LPKILQSDNGTEFKNKELKELINGWDQGRCTIVHGRPRHPQSQGKVEQSNRTLSEMLAAFKIQFNTEKWVKIIIY